MKRFIIMSAAILLTAVAAQASMISGVMDGSERYAWSEKWGMVDMTNVIVEDGGLSGYAMAGSERLDFKIAEFQVRNDGNGILSGLAKSQNYGSFNFSGVQIGVDGVFQGVADGGSIGGKIIFDCPRNIACANGTNARARTDWRPASYRLKNGSGSSNATPAVISTVNNVPAASVSSQVAAPVDYKACDNISDYVSYVKCIADVDAKNNRSNVPSSETSVNNDYSVIIAAGVEYVKVRQVPVAIKAPAAATTIAVSRDSNFGFAAREPMASNKNIELDDTPDIEQYVYVKFFDKNGQALYVASDSVIYSTLRGDQDLELWAQGEFAKIVGRLPSGAAGDKAMVAILAYGLPKNQARQLALEQSALARFIREYKRKPQDGRDWNIVNALAYGKPDTATVATVDNSSGACQSIKPLTANLSLGAKNTEVKYLQDKLRCLGYLPADSKETASFDESLEKAVSAFQEKNNLKCNDGSYCGFVGPATKKALNAAAPKVLVDKAVVKSGKLVGSLTVGAKGEEVRRLQSWLIAAGFLIADQASGVFDAATEKAVSAFQEKNNLKCNDGSYCGFVGPATRAKLNQLYAK